MAIYLTPDGLNSTTSGEMPNFPHVISRVSGTTSYYLTNGGSLQYTAPAIKIGTFTSNSSTCFMRGRYIKTGDLNYSTLITDVSFIWHQWSNQNTRYNLRVVANSANNRPSYWWVDNTRSLWCWQTDLWSQYGRIIIEASDRVDFLTGGSNDNMAPSNAYTKAWTGQTRNLCDNSTTISIEDTFGNPA